jgi:hypothetical protein
MLMIEDLLIIICKDGATRKEITTTLLLFGIEQQEINSLFNRLYYLKKIHKSDFFLDGKKWHTFINDLPRARIILSAVFKADKNKLASANGVPQWIWANDKYELFISKFLKDKNEENNLQ